MVVRKTGDKVTGFEPGGREFESLRARHIFQALNALP